MNINEVIELSFSPHGVSKNITTENLGGREFAAFEAFFDGTWRKVWASLEHGVIVAGIGQLSGNTWRIMQDIAMNEAIDIADARGREPMPSPAAEQSGGAFLKIETTLAVAREASCKFAKGQDAQAAAWKAKKLRQDAVWDSIDNADHEAIRQMAIDQDCIRTVTVKSGLFPFHDRPCRFYVPPTGHWAGWRDDDALRHHGQTSVKDMCDRFLVLSSEPWDGTYRHLWFFDGLDD